jgi:biofilm protein TabA
MVFDHLEYASHYFNLGHGIRAALVYLQQADVAALEPGRHSVEGDRVFALVSDYETKSPEEGFWEAHRQHVDVQYVHSGRERIGYADLASFDTEPYDAARDLVIARGAGGQFVEMAPGDFVILFPHDAHMPGLTAQAPSSVRKVVVKVRIG